MSKIFKKKMFFFFNFRLVDKNGRMEYLLIICNLSLFTNSLEMFHLSVSVKCSPKWNICTISGHALKKMVLNAFAFLSKNIFCCYEDIRY